MSAIPTRTVTITQPVTSLNVQSYGAPIQITTGSGPDVTVAEAISFSGDTSPAVTAQVTGGQLTLAAPACAQSDCSVGFTVTLPTACPRHRRELRRRHHHLRRRRGQPGLRRRRGAGHGHHRIPRHHQRGRPGAPRQRRRGERRLRRRRGAGREDLRAAHRQHRRRSCDGQRPDRGAARRHRRRQPDRRKGSARRRRPSPPRAATRGSDSPRRRTACRSTPEAVPPTCPCPAARTR